MFDFPEGNTLLFLVTVKYEIQKGYEKDEANHVSVVFNQQTLNGVILEEKRLKLPLIRTD